MRMIILAFMAVCSASAALARTPPDVVTVSAILPGPQEFEAPPAIEAIEDHSVVLLDLTLSVEAYPSFEGEDGLFSTLEGDCDFGPMQGDRMMSIPTGSNHLVMYVRPGDPARFAANGVTCEYMHSLQLGENIGQVVTVRGCYLANAHAIPTARLLMLNPLPARACGLTQ